MRRINDAGLRLIKNFEGLRLKAYKPVPTEKYYTIGYGHYGADVAKDMSISEETAMQYLLSDLERFQAGVSRLVNVEILTDNQYAALVSFAFNLGLTNLSNSTLLKKVKRNPCDPSIRTEFCKWVLSAGRRLPGLVRRRNAEADLYFSK